MLTGKNGGRPKKQTKTKEVQTGEIALLHFD